MINRFSRSRSSTPYVNWGSVRQQTPNELQELQALLENPFGHTPLLPHTNGLMHLPFSESRFNSPDMANVSDTFHYQSPSPAPILTAIDPRLLMGRMPSPEPVIKSEASSEYELKLEPSPEPDIKHNSFSASTSSQVQVSSLSPKEAAKKAKQEAIENGANEVEAMQAYQHAYSKIYRTLPKRLKVNNSTSVLQPKEIAKKAKAELIKKGVSEKEAHKEYMRVYRAERQKLKTLS